MLYSRNDPLLNLEYHGRSKLFKQLVDIEILFKIAQEGLNLLCQRIEWNLHQRLTGLQGDCFLPFQ